MGTKTGQGVGTITRKKKVIQKTETENYGQENMKKGRTDSMEINSATNSNMKGIGEQGLKSIATVEVGNQPHREQ